MSLRYLLLLILFTPAFHAYTQPLKILELKADASFFSTDIEGNLYYTDHDSLVKISPPYHHYYSFHFRKNERPDYIDVSNPSQLVCLFRYDQQLILLDSTLQIMVRPFYLDEIGLYDISTVVSSENQGLWFYNNYTNSLIKLNKNFVPEIHPVDLNPYITNPNSISYMTTFQSDLYIDVPGKGVLVLDKYGNFKTAYNLPGIPDFQILNDTLFYYRDNAITGIDLKSFKHVTIPLPLDLVVINAHILPQFLLLQTKDKIFIFKRDHH